MGISREAGISLAFGIAVGSLTWATLSVIGLTVIFSEFSLALYVVKILGGAYLLWLAYKSFKSAFTNHEIETKKILTGK